MKHSPWKSLVVLALAGSTVLCLSACENKNVPGATANTTSSASASNATTIPGMRKVDGIQVEDVREGTGQVAQKGNTVTVNYLGTLASTGQKFDSSYDRNEPFSFQLGSGQVIEGWEKGIIGMKVGGKRILLIPPDEAYGDQAVGDVIPPNATLKFEVELLDVN